MSGRHPLLDLQGVGALVDHLADVGTVFRVFDRQDSGCLSYGVALADERWFVKTATTRAAERALRRAIAVHAAVRHPAIVPLAHRFTAAGVPTLVYPWVDGDLLYHPTLAGTMPRHDPRSVWSRFRRLRWPTSRPWWTRSWPRTSRWSRPVSSSATSTTGACFTTSTVDGRTSVFDLGRGIRLLLDGGDDEAAWRGSAAQLAVVATATRPDPADRYGDVAELAAAWRA